MKIIGLAGGSGAGKSTVCEYLLDKGPDTYEVMSLDDYQKLKTDKSLPRLNGKINWDHPNAIDWPKLKQDLESLTSGLTIQTQVWTSSFNPDYHKTGKMIARKVSPRPILILEGYLALYSSEINKFYSTTIFLDLDTKTRNERRGKNDLVGDPDYINQVLTPMHDQYVEPTKYNADLLIDVKDKTVEDITQEIMEEIR